MVVFRLAFSVISVFFWPALSSRRSAVWSLVCVGIQLLLAFQINLGRLEVEGGRNGVPDRSRENTRASDTNSTATIVCDPLLMFRQRQGTLPSPLPLLLGFRAQVDFIEPGPRPKSAGRLRGSASTHSVLPAL